MISNYFSETLAVEVFKTNVYDPDLAQSLVEKIQERFDLISVNFDLEDCDRILRVEGYEVNTEEVIHLLTSCGISAELLM
jgi:hypothetical protein